MNKDKIVDDIIEGICYRYHDIDMAKGEQLFYEALNAVDIQEKIYDKVFQLINPR